MSTDLPAQGLLQQLNARPVPGEHLEVLGKQAAALWQSGGTTALSQAVVTTVKQAGLSPEQVRRVIEFTNSEAYLREFKKEGSTHRVVDFPGGPADPVDVLKDLNDGGGGSVFDTGTLDYQTPPSSMKMASAGEEQEFQALFGPPAPALPLANPYEEVLVLRDKLAAVQDNLTSNLSGLEVAYADLADRIYHNIKQAALSGQHLGEVVRAWGEVAPSPEYVKVAFQLLTPRLLREEVFRSLDAIGASLEKTGNARMVNWQHPLVIDFDEYCGVLTKMAELRQQKEEVEAGHGQLTAFLKKADGVIPKVLRAAEKAAPHAGNAASHVARALMGEGAGETARGLAEKAVKYSPHAAALIGANEVRRTLKNSPGFQSAKNTALSVVPMTPQYQQREWGMQGGGGGFY